MLKRTILILSVIYSTLAAGVETCSRLATINYQDVLVDASSSNRGEGLRFYLSKDPVSKELLNQYQLNNRPTWKSAAASTFGTAMLLVGLLRNDSGEDEAFTNKNFLILGGMSLIGFSYLVSKTNQYRNEYLLLNAIEEYNKRNNPKIYFSPTIDGKGAGVGIGKEF
jgi:hypothetical protein